VTEGTAGRCATELPITDAQHATKVEFLLAPTGTGNGSRAVSLGVRATGPGGTTDKVVGVYHPEQQS
jgi:hypothetical protein